MLIVVLIPKAQTTSIHAATDPSRIAELLRQDFDPKERTRRRRAAKEKQQKAPSYRPADDEIGSMIVHVVYLYSFAFLILLLLPSPFLLGLPTSWE
ncbi:hypothetical protein QE152_g37020 [Popillia japonica]|uniref:Uncharacterized protein n=1 Tax=Popillia japonica TaxID=7064 RepID=A0AAW1IBU4_POPJA